MTGGYEAFYINLACFCKKLGKFEESLSYCEKTIEFLQSLLRNNGLIKQIAEELKREKQSFDFFLIRKNAQLAYVFYMKGKILIKQEKEDLAEDFLNKAYRLMKEYLGENNEKTIKFKTKFETLKRRLAFLNEMGQNTDVKDFQAFKLEIEARCSPKNDISSISELEETSHINSRLDQQPLQIPKSAQKKPSSFLISTNNNPKKSLSPEEHHNKSPKGRSEASPLKKLKIPATFGPFFEKDQNFRDLLKNSRIIYPRGKTPIPKHLQLSFEQKNSTKLFSMNKTRSSSKSKTPSPNHQTFSLLSGFLNNSNKSSLINSSTFYNKLRVNSQKTKALYQATIARFFQGSGTAPRTESRPSMASPPKERTFYGRQNPKIISIESKIEKDLSNLVFEDPVRVLKESKMEMILNQRPKTPVNFFRSTRPGIQIFQNCNEKPSPLIPERKKSHGEDELLDPVLTKMERPDSQSRTPKNHPHTVIFNSPNLQTQDKGKRHTLSINTLNLSKKTFTSTTRSRSRNKRFSMVDSVFQTKDSTGTAINSPNIKTLASIAESYGKSNDSQVLSKNDSSIDSNSQPSMTNPPTVFVKEKERKYSGMTGISDVLVEKQSSFKASIPRLSRENINSYKDSSSQQKSQKEISHQMTFQHMKLDDPKRLKTMKSLDFNQNTSKIGTNTSVVTPVSPKKFVRKAATKKSISFIKEGTKPVFRKMNTNEMLAAQSEELTNNVIINEFKDVNNNQEFSQNILEEEMTQIQSPLMGLNSNVESKLEKAVKFIQKTFRKILQKKLTFITNLMNDKRYINDSNNKLLNEIENKLSQLKIKEVLLLLRSAKATSNIMTFQEILTLKRFPIRFFTSSLNGFGQKCVFWSLDQYDLQEEFKMIMTDPNDAQSTDEWRYHESFVLVLHLRNSLNCDLILEFRTKERLSLERLKIKYVWKVANMMIDEWFHRQDFFMQFQSFLKETEDQNLENKQIIAFSRKNEEMMTETDQKELCGFRDRLVFIVEKRAFLIRKPVGLCWRFQIELKNSINYSSLNRELSLFLQEKSRARRYRSTYMPNNFGVLFSKYGLERIVKNEDPTSDIKLFFENFEPWLKDNTFDILHRQRRAKANSEKWSKNDISIGRGNKSRIMKFSKQQPLEIENSLNFASFHMNSPTKPFNLLNFDLLNKYNLDDEFSDFDTPKDSLPQINPVHQLAHKKSSPKINVILTDKEESNKFNKMVMSECFSSQHFQNLGLAKIHEANANLKLPGQSVEDSFHLPPSGMIEEVPISFEKTVSFVQEKMRFSSSNLKLRRPSRLDRGLKINPVKVLEFKPESSLLHYPQKAVILDIFPMKSYKIPIEAPMKYINPFYKGQLMLQSIVKIEKMFFEMHVYFEPKTENTDNFKMIHLSSTEEAEELLTKRMTEWEILVKLTRLQKGDKFTEEIKIDFARFVTLFIGQFPWEKVLKLLYNRGFSRHDQKLMLLNSLSIFRLEKCRIVIKDGLEKQNIEKNEEFPTINFSSALDVLLPQETPLPKNKISNFNYFPGEVSLKRPNSHFVTFGDSIQTLTHYNTIKFLNKSSYYIRMKLIHKSKFVRVNFVNPENATPHIRISYYEPMNAVREYCRVTAQRDIEKIINVLQLTGEKLKRKIFNMYLNIRNDLVGRKLYFFKEWPLRSASTSLINQSPLTKQNCQAIKLTTISQHDDPFIKTFYQTKTFYEPFKLDFLGKCYVKITYFKPNEKFMSSNNFFNRVFFKFEFFPYSSKTKIYKLLISLYDIQFKLKIRLRFENERVLMISLNRLILKRLRMMKSDLYSSIFIPFSEFSHNSKKFLTYQMKFRKLQYESKEIISFLEQEYLSYQTIFRIVKKIKKAFCVITVQRHNFLHHWALKIYVPLSNRHFLCYINNEDIIKMNSDFLEMLYPFEMENLNRIFSNSFNSITYDRFSQKYKTMRSDASSYHSESNSELQPKKRHPFIEMKFWEDLLNNMQLSLDNNGKLRLRINNFKGIIREFLFNEILLKSNPEKLLFFEVFFENRKSKSAINIFNKLPDVSYDSANHYNIYIRLTNLQSLGVSNEKFTLRDLIYSYSLDPLNQVDTKRLVKTVFLQSEFKNFCKYLKFRLQSQDYHQNLLCLLKTSKESNPNLSYLIQKDFTGKALKRLNCSIGLQNIHFNNEKKFVLIYKAVFTLKPLKMVSVSFCIHKLMFHVDIYNLKSGKTFIKKIPLFVVRSYLPFIKQMLSWSLFHLIGERMIQIFKNSLIVESYLQGK